MENLNWELKTEGKDNYLIIKAKLPASKKELPQSKSGKSLVYASTNGNVNSGLKVNGSDLIIGLNVYTKVVAK